MTKKIALAIVATAILAALLVPASVPPAAADGTPDLALAKDMPGRTLLGTDIPVTLTLTNPSGPDGFNATFTDTLPAGVSYVPGSASPDPTELPQGDGTTVLVWKNVADALTGTTVTLDYSIATDGSFEVGDTVTNSAAAYANSDARVVPVVHPTTGAVTGGYTGSATASDTTELIAFQLSKNINCAD